MFVYPDGPASGKRRRVAQGPNSGELKFKRPICEACNSAVTQKPDRAYHDLITALELEGGGEAGLFELDPSLSDDMHYLAVCRYFGKLLGNHLADMGAPIPIRLCDFVSGATANNCVYLAVRDDPRGGELRSGFEGVAVITALPDLHPVRVHTSLTVGKTQFLFGLVFAEAEIAALRVQHAHFVEACRASAEATRTASKPDPILAKLGLSRGTG